MNEKVIGYRGLVSGELMLYISRILFNLGLKVLVCDCSPVKELNNILLESKLERKSLSTIDIESVKADRGYIYESRVNEHTEYAGTVEEYMEYRGITHTEDFFEDGILECFDAVLINFGFADTHSKIEKCNYINYVTDMDKINISKLLNMKIDIDREYKNHLLIQNVVKGGIAAYACADAVMTKLSIDTCSLVRLSSKDVMIKPYAGYNNIFKFKSISRDLYNYLYFCIWNIYSDKYEKKQILKAVDIAVKGG